MDKHSSLFRQFGGKKQLLHLQCYNIYALFITVSSSRKKASVFVPSKPFQLYKIFTSGGGAYPIAATFAAQFMGTLLAL